MTPTAHEFSLYRSGWSGDAVPWSDNQLWAQAAYVRMPENGENGEHCINLDPRYGSAASWYRLTLFPGESPEDGWTAWRAHLDIDACRLSWAPLPLVWYTAEPADWPSGLARFREPDGFRPPTFPWPNPSPRAVWTIAARRVQ